MGKKSTGAKQLEEDFQIQPEKVTPTLDTSNWPLLLKVTASLPLSAVEAGAKAAVIARTTSCRTNTRVVCSRGLSRTCTFRTCSEYVRTLGSLGSTPRQSLIFARRPHSVVSSNACL